MEGIPRRKAGQATVRWWCRLGREAPRFVTRGLSGMAGVVVAIGAVAAAITLAPGAVSAQPASPGTRPPVPAARPPAPAPVPHVIRPSAVLGPGLPGQPVPQSAVPAGQPAPMGASEAQGTRSAAAAGSTAVPTFPGMARFRSIGRDEAVMFDAPSEKARKIFVAPQGMPVEVVSVLRTWVKVRDALGDLAWVNRDDLSDRRMLIATTVAPLRRDPQPLAPVWFSVDRGVVLELLDERAVNGFVKVRYADGEIGYLQLAQVWGL